MAHPHGSAPNQMVNRAANNGDDDQQQQHRRHHQQLQQNYLQASQHIDVRMKRHPELQPYVPSDRDRFLAGSKGSGGGGGGGSSLSGRLNSHNVKTVNKLKVTPNTMTNSNDAKLSSLKQKKCVSMTRLDQLARPKKVFTQNPAPTASTLTTSTAPRTSTAPSPVVSTSRTSAATSSIVSTSRTSAAPSSIVSTPRTSTAPSPIVSTSRNSTAPSPIVPTSRTSTAPTTAPSPTASTPTNSTGPTSTTSPAPSTAQQVSFEQHEESSIAEQLSTNDPHYQSAASELVLDSETSTNGISPQKNLGNLCQDLQAELIAEGIVKPSLHESIEEKLREVARRNEEERQSRQLLVDNILSRMNTSS